MEDRSPFVCHRMSAAQATNQSGGRGYDFRPSHESHIALRALGECLRPRSLFIFAAIGAVASVWWL
jgi:hypothetical protein